VIRGQRGSGCVRGRQSEKGKMDQHGDGEKGSVEAETDKVASCCHLFGLICNNYVIII
jgi:hypothetical protein